MLRELKAARTRRHFERRGARVVRGRIQGEDVTEELAALGVSVEPYTIDAAGFEAYLERMPYARARYYAGGRSPAAREKYLEHYVSLELLAPRRGDVLIDVASMNSPFAEFVTEIGGLDAYRQDLIFPPGIRGRTIGGDAAAMPVPDAFADHLTLHCSFEHFEGDSDSRFIREAERVLKPGGKLCSLPLYTTARYALQTHTRRWRMHGFSFDPGDLVYVGDNWGPPHMRFYDAAAFVSRIVAHLGSMRLRVLRVTNLEELGPDLYLSFAMLVEKPA